MSKIKLALIPVALTCLGLLSLYSIEPPLDSAGQDMFESMFFRQLLFLCIAVLIMIVVSNIHYRRFWSTSHVWYGLSIVMLIAVLLFAKNVRGARSWFKIGIFSFQPSELVRIFLVIVVAKYMSTREKLVGRDLLIIFAMVLIPILLITAQPDMGMALITLVSVVIMVYASGITFRQSIPVLIILLAACPLIYKFGLRDYQKERINAAFKMTSLDSRYQVDQSIKAIVSGGISGKGIGQASLTMPFYVPDRHNDFIYSHICEELGIAGSLGLVFLFGVFFLSSLRLAFWTRDLFARYVVVGLTLGLFVQFSVNIAMTIGIFPVTGLNLPFVSYGGSSLFASYVAAGVILSVNRFWRPEFSEKRLPESAFTITPTKS